MSMFQLRSDLLALLLGSVCIKIVVLHRVRVRVTVSQCIHTVSVLADKETHTTAASRPRPPYSSSIIARQQQMTPCKHTWMWVRCGWW